VIHFSEFNEEVLYTTEPVTRLDRADIDFLKERSKKNKRKRVRLCAHLDAENALHEMMIVHHAGNYIPPHKHPGKSESFHMIEGVLKIVLFDDDGSILEVIKLDAGGMEGSFYYRLSNSFYHTVIPVSDIVVFHEITNGPFRREDMIFAEWAPDEEASSDTIRSYSAELSRLIA